MTRDRVYGVGLPFDARWSSCSDRRPRYFDWTADAESANVHTTVCVGAGVLEWEKISGPKIAWLAESPAIEAWQNVTALIESRLDEVLDAFEVVLSSDRSFCAKDPRIVHHPAASNLPWTPEPHYGVHRKRKVCSMIASSKRMVPGHDVRQQYADNLKNKLDLFGGACGSPRVGDDTRRLDKMDGLGPYMFSVAMENCQVSLYYTEKLTDCFATGTVPIYWGSSAIGEIFDAAGIIHLDESFDPHALSEDLYESMLPAIRNNLAIVRRLESADDLLYLRYLRD